MELRPDLGNKRLSETIRLIVEESYDIGRLIRIKEVLGGYCNKSYAVWMSVDDRVHRYFLRLYNPNAVEKEILFEHALLNHLRSNGFTLAAAIVPSRNGATMLSTPPPDNHPGGRALWALFEFLDGEDKYTWTNTNLSDDEFVSAAEILAHLHHCGHGFKKPPEADRVQPRIMEFIPTFKRTFSVFLERAGGRRCDRLFKENYGRISNALDIATSYNLKFQGMQELTIHCDYHPGNLKYRDEKGVGIFDFDWSKIDYRLFDVALSLVYFTSVWDDRKKGLRADKFALFLNAYNGACHRFKNIDPLTKQERIYLVPMLAIANLYVLNWDLVDFYETSQPNDDEYYTYIKHNVDLMHWIALHEAEIEIWTKQSSIF